MAVRVVRVEGDAGARGEQVGAALADPIRRSLAFYRAFVERRGLSVDALPSRLAPFRAAAEAAYPHLVAEIEGMARGAGVSPWELFAVNAFEELEPSLLSTSARLERCTAFVVQGDAGPILGHNEQWYAGDAGNAAVVVARPEEGVPFASPTVATCLPAVGMNGGGGAQGIMSLVADDDHEGIPRVLVSRESLQASGAVDAIARATPPHRAGGYAHLFAFPNEDPFVVETTSTRHAVLTDRPAHTNHYLDADLAAAAPEPSANTRSRLERAEQLLQHAAPSTPEEVMRVLADHANAPDSICAHPDAARGDEADAIVFSLVCDVGRGRMWVAPGNPCRAPFEEIDLRGVFA